MDKARLAQLASLCEKVALRHSAIALACVASCGLATAEDWGTTQRDTTGSTRLYNLPLVSELPADAANCVTSDSQAQAYAAQVWAQYRAAYGDSAKLPRVDVNQCSTERSVASVRSGETLRDVVLGNVISVMPSGALQYMARGTGTFEKTVATAPPAPAATPSPPSPAPAPEDNSSWASPSPAPAPWVEPLPPAPAPAPVYTPAPAPAPVDDCWWCAPPPPAPVPPPPPPAPEVCWWCAPPPPAPAPPPPPPPPAPAPVGCIYTNSCGGPENTAEVWGPNVWAPAPPPPSGGGSGWSWGGGFWEQP